MRSTEESLVTGLFTDDTVLLERVMTGSVGMDVKKGIKNNSTLPTLSYASETRT